MVYDVDADGYGIRTDNSGLRIYDVSSHGNGTNQDGHGIRTDNSGLRIYDVSSHGNGTNQDGHQIYHST
jgi:hypothetical protein